MTELRALLKESGIQKSVVIDDVFDDVPRPDELNEEDWSIFFDDLNKAEDKLLAEIYPAYGNSSPHELQLSQEFIAVLWDNREKKLKAACDPLFKDYETTNAADRKGLEALVSTLEGLGLSCKAIGRELDQEAKDADLVFIDLFLGFQQSDDDMARAIQRVRDLIKDREQSPPLVVLMSRSTRLADKRSEFRDSAGLLGSTFRFVSKKDLAKDGKLEILLTRLASHYDDAKRVAGFVHAWDSGLDEARKRFIKVLRRLDLSDLAQIQTLILDFEEQKLGEYLLDVADRVLQHEIEAETGTISAAQELNKIELSKYPAPHLAGSPDLQELVHRMIFQHVERLKLSNDEDAPQIQFGDLLRRHDQKTGAVTDEVLLVVTPACDLARCGVENILVLPGLLKPLAARDWSYRSTVAKTPIFTSTDGSRFWIKWDLKGRRTIPTATLRKKLREANGYGHLGRFREMYAIEIQQRMLTDMGRIGQPANLPATFPVSIGLYVVSPEATALPVPIDALDTAICFVGHDQDSKRVDHLVLSEAACDALQNTIREFSNDAVHAHAQVSLTSMKADVRFFDQFERGLIEVPLKEDTLRPINGANNLIYMHLVRNNGVNDDDPIKGNYRKGPFIMKICDVAEPSNS